MPTPAATLGRPGSDNVLRAVLFDLDDTLFDHCLCARTALTEMHAAHPEFQACPLDDFEQLHAAHLEELHPLVTRGELPLEEARRERLRRLFREVGASPPENRIAEAAEAYRASYIRIRQPIAGAAALLAAVKARALVGIVTNNLLQEQQDKLRECALDGYVDELVVSEKAGVSKPDPRIFEIALERLGCHRHEAAMVGDSWPADVAGAIAAGIRPIWFNPLRKPRPDPIEVDEIHALEPIEDALRVIFRG
jgi:HAD superfamily hydrolase (TIGR01509 family)